MEPILSDTEMLEIINGLENKDFKGFVCPNRVKIRRYTWEHSTGGFIIKFDGISLIAIYDFYTDRRTREFYKENTDIIVAIAFGQVYVDIPEHITKETDIRWPPQKEAYIEEVSDAIRYLEKRNKVKDIHVMEKIFDTIDKEVEDKQKFWEDIVREGTKKYGMLTKYAVKT